MQVLTVIAMERPVSFGAEDIRDEKVRTMSNVISSSLVAFNPTLGQGFTRDSPDRARGHSPWSICGCQRKAWLPR
jgi:hypothetical protein